MAVASVIKSASESKNVMKRKASEVDVPALTADPDERKRVLNVLAQRRYRERKREHIKKLECHLSGQSPVSLDRTAANARVPQNKTTTHDPVVNVTLPTSEGYFGSLGTTAACQNETICPSLIDQTATLDTSLPDVNDLLSESTWDTSILLPSIASVSTSSLKGLTCTSTSPTDSLDSWDRFPITGYTSTFLDAPTPNALATTTARPLDLSTALQLDDSTSHSFSDEHGLQILEVNLLLGCFAIARRLHLEDLLWSFTATSPFTDPKLRGTSFEHLPPNLRPSKVQLTVPHHPILDILPWPVTRDNLIQIFSLPEEMRPPMAASSTALVDLVSDLEDSAEGVRIWGDDPCSEKNWEIGQRLFRNWWWSFDGKSVRESNRWRKRRGAKLLGGGRVVGEVEEVVA